MHLKIKFAEQRTMSSMDLKLLEQQSKCTWTVGSLGITAYGGNNEGTMSISSSRWNVRILGCKDLRRKY